MLYLTLSTRNDAFAADHNGEIARILRETALRIEAGEPMGRLLDANGNLVGRFDIGDSFAAHQGRPGGRP